MSAPEDRTEQLCDELIDRLIRAAHAHGQLAPFSRLSTEDRRLVAREVVRLAFGYRKTPGSNASMAAKVAGQVRRTPSLASCARITGGESLAAAAQYMSMEYFKG